MVADGSDWLAPFLCLSALEETQIEKQHCWRAEPWEPPNSATRRTSTLLFLAFCTLAEPRQAVRVPGLSF